MARPPRLSFPGAHFHLLNRFVDRHPFFQVEADYRCFLDTYFQFAGLHSVRTFAYCLMPNHFHVVVETGRGGLSAFLQQVMSRVAHELNHRHGRGGHLFQGRTKSLLIEDGSYFETACGYVLLNPVRAGLCRDPLEYRWSSAGAMVAKVPEYPVDGPALVERISGSVFAPTDMVCQQEALLRWLKGLVVEVNETHFCGSQRGTFISSSGFRRRVLAENERRSHHEDTRKRRFTDRDLAPVTWGEMGEMAAEAVHHAPQQVIHAWRTVSHACADARVFIAHRIALWSLDRIRHEEQDRFTTARYSMALTEMARNPLKAELARRIGVRLAVSQFQSAV